MDEVPLYSIFNTFSAIARVEFSILDTTKLYHRARSALVQELQGYLAHKKYPPRRILQ